MHLMHFKKTPYDPALPNAEQGLSLSQQLPVSQRFLRSLSQSLWLHTCHSSQVSAAAELVLSVWSAPVPHLSVTGVSPLKPPQLLPIHICLPFPSEGG